MQKEEEEEGEEEDPSKYGEKVFCPQNTSFGRINLSETHRQLAGIHVCARVAMLNVSLLFLRLLSYLRLLLLLLHLLFRKSHSAPIN